MAVSADSGKKIIRNIKDLPDWYDLEKYHAASSLDAAGWFDLLLQRWSYDLYQNQFPSINNAVLNSGLQKLRQNPLSLTTDDNLIYLIGGGRLSALKCDPQDFAKFAHAISPLTLRRLYQKERYLKNETRIRIRNYMDQIYDWFGKQKFEEIPKSEHEWARSFLDIPIFDAFLKQDNQDDVHLKRSHDIVQIDLSVPDKILIEQFADYLSKIRENTDITPANPYKAPEYKKWIEYGLLPYLDLKLWEIENKVSVPYRVLADAIFPDGNMGEEMIRKTTKKIADQVMSKDYIDFLATMAAQEIAEKI